MVGKGILCRRDELASAKFSHSILTQKLFAGAMYSCMSCMLLKAGSPVEREPACGCAKVGVPLRPH